MRFAILADVHGNLPALERVLGLLEQEAIDAYLCAGDLVGYGPYPNECIDRLVDLGVICVAGNHDLIASSRLSSDGIGKLARQTLTWTTPRLRDDNLRLLGRLPLQAEVGPVLLAHGSIGDPRRYVTPDRVAGELGRLDDLRADASVLVLGHTHRPLAYGSETGELIAGRSGRARWNVGEALALNPGSVGQSRERLPLARFAVVDLERREVELRDTLYDHRACRRALRRRGLPARACHINPDGLRARVGRARRWSRPARQS